MNLQQENLFGQNFGTLKNLVASRKPEFRTKTRKKHEILKKSMFYHFEVRTDGRQDELVGVQGVAVLAPQHEVGVQA